MGNVEGKYVLRDEDVEALVKTSGRTEKQVRDSFDKFLVDHPTGRIDPAAFSSLMSEALPSKDATTMSTHVFRTGIINTWIWHVGGLSKNDIIIVIYQLVHLLTII